MLKHEQSEPRRINEARQEGLSLRVERSFKNPDPRLGLTEADGAEAPPG